MPLKLEPRHSRRDTAGQRTLPKRDVVCVDVRPDAQTAMIQLPARLARYKEVRPYRARPGYGGAASSTVMTRKASPAVEGNNIQE